MVHVRCRLQGRAARRQQRGAVRLRGAAGRADGAALHVNASARVPGNRAAESTPPVQPAPPAPGGTLCCMGHGHESALNPESLLCHDVITGCVFVLSFKVAVTAAMIECSLRKSARRSQQGHQIPL